MLLINLRHQITLLVLSSLLFLQTPTACMMQLMKHEKNKTTQHSLKTLVQKGFSAETQVPTPDGPKKIKDLKVKDIILTYHPSSGELQKTYVKKIFQNQVDRLIKLTIAGTVMYAGTDQEFFDGTSWIKARELVKSTIATFGNQSTNIEHVELQKLDEKTYLHDISVGSGTFCIIPKHTNLHINVHNMNGSGIGSFNPDTYRRFINPEVVDAAIKNSNKTSIVRIFVDSVEKLGIAGTIFGTLLKVGSFIGLLTTIPKDKRNDMQPIIREEVVKRATWGRIKETLTFLEYWEVYLRTVPSWVERKSEWELKQEYEEYLREKRIEARYPEQFAGLYNHLSDPDSFPEYKRRIIEAPVQDAQEIKETSAIANNGEQKNVDVTPQESSQETTNTNVSVNVPEIQNNPSSTFIGELLKEPVNFVTWQDLIRKGSKDNTLIYKIMGQDVLETICAGSLEKITDNLYTGKDNDGNTIVLKVPALNQLDKTLKKLILEKYRGNVEKYLSDQALLAIPMVATDIKDLIKNSTKDITINEAIQSSSTQSDKTTLLEAVPQTETKLITLGNDKEQAIRTNAQNELLGQITQQTIVIENDQKNFATTLQQAARNELSALSNVTTHKEYVGVKTLADAIKTTPNVSANTSQNDLNTQSINWPTNLEIQLVEGLFDGIATWMNPDYPINKKIVNLNRFLRPHIFAYHKIKSQLTKTLSIWNNKKPLDAQDLTKLINQFEKKVLLFKKIFLQYRYLAAQRSSTYKEENDKLIKGLILDEEINLRDQEIISTIRTQNNTNLVLQQQATLTIHNLLNSRTQYATTFKAFVQEYEKALKLWKQQEALATDTKNFAVVINKAQEHNEAYKTFHQELMRLMQECSQCKITNKDAILKEIIKSHGSLETSFNNLLLIAQANTERKNAQQEIINQITALHQKYNELISHNTFDLYQNALNIWQQSASLNAPNIENEIRAVEDVLLTIHDVNTQKEELLAKCPACFDERRTEQFELILNSEQGIEKTQQELNKTREKNSINLGLQHNINLKLRGLQTIYNTQVHAYQDILDEFYKAFDFWRLKPTLEAEDFETTIRQTEIGLEHIEQTTQHKKLLLGICSQAENRKEHLAIVQQAQGMIDIIKRKLAIARILNRAKIKKQKIYRDEFDISPVLNLITVGVGAEESDTIFDEGRSIVLEQDLFNENRKNQNKKIKAIGKKLAKLKCSIKDPYDSNSDDDNDDNIKKFKKQIKNSDIIKQLNDVIKKLSKNLNDTKTRTRTPDTLHIKELAKLEKLATELWKQIRLSKTDINQITKNTGIPKFIIKQIKKHVFFAEHILHEGIQRFAPEINMAEAWMRLAEGTFTKSDLLWLQHELSESVIMQDAKVPYSVAHAFINRIYPWYQKLLE